MRRYFETLKQVFMNVLNWLKSTNGQNNVVLAAMWAVLAFFGVDNPEGIGVAALIMAVTEIIKGQRKGAFTWNVYTYIATAIVALVPWVSDFFAILQPLAQFLYESIATGGSIDYGALIGLALPVLNQILYIVKNKPWIPKTE